MLALAPLLLGAAGDEPVVRFFVVFAVMLAAGKLASELFERLGQPPVLGELIAGIALGTSALRVIPTDPADPLTGVFRLLAAVGVVVLLFEIGLETDLRAMARVGAAATAVAVVGVVLPFGLAFVYWLSPLNPYEHTLAAAGTTAVFVGAALTATSVGITARVLADLNKLQTVEARLVLGAAVIDDVLGLVLLGVVSGLAAGATVSALGVVRMLGVAVGFLVAAVLIGLAIAPRLFNQLARTRVRGGLPVAALAMALLLAALADRAGSAMIIGAFAAGLILAGTRQFERIERGVKPVADVFTPVFFLSIGASVDLRAFGDPTVLAIGGSFKVAAGWAPFWCSSNRLAVGIGMVPRGEVGLIFAQIGLSAGVLSPQLFTALLLMVIGTTFVAPPLLKWAFARGGSTAERFDIPTPGAEH